MLSKESSNLFLRVYEIMLCIYIVVAPINNALNDLGVYAMVGLAAMLLLAVGTLCAWLGKGFDVEKKMGGIFTAIYLVVGLGSAGTLFHLIEYHGAAQILLFAQFISLSRHINLKKVYMAFYISAIISAMFSFSLGWVSSTVSRTAASVDGSIAPAVLAITMFGIEDFEKTRAYKTMKNAGMIGSIVVAFFGMSRSRLLLIGIMVVIKIFLNMRESATSGRISQTALLLIPVVLILIGIALRMDVTQQLLREIELRYEGGFEDTIREEEANAGWMMFKKDWMFGRGWKKFVYKVPEGYQVYNNHNMYITILARGGIVLGFTMLYSFFKLIMRTVERKKLFAYILLGLFFALGYGNAGAFNYTICTMMIPLAVVLDQKDEVPDDEEEENDENNLYSQG